MPEYKDTPRNIPPAVLVDVYEERVKRQFDLDSELKKRKGIFLEVGGPTLPDEKLNRTYRLVDITKLPQKLVTSNIDPGITRWEFDYEKAEAEGYAGDEEDYMYAAEFLPADLVADATDLKMENGSVGALFASALPVEIRKKVLLEAYRVLEPGGIVVWQYGRKKDAQDAGAAGFDVKVFVRISSDDETIDFIFQKPEFPKQKTSFFQRVGKVLQGKFS